MAKLLGGTTVYGLLSTTGVIYASGGNSNQWNSNWTITNSNSANWILDGGNTKASTIEVGTRDNFSFFIRSNNINRIKVNDTTGNVAIYDGLANFVPNEKLTVIGNISASGTLNVRSVSSRSLDLIHLPANDGTNPTLRIGEYDTTSGNQGFSGMFMSYNEFTNTFGISSQFAPAVGIPAVSINRSGRVGIGIDTPSENLTVAGNISATGIIYATGGNSDQWNSNRSTTNSNSAGWSSVYTSFNSNSAKYDSNSTTTNSNSASWSSVYTSFNSNSAKYDSNSTTTNSNSASWSNWSSVSASYALGTQYVKLSGDNMTGGLSVPAVSSQNIYGDGDETVFSDGLTTTGNGTRTLTLNYTNGIYATSTRIVLTNLPTASAGLPAGALWNSGGFLKIV